MTNNNVTSFLNKQGTNTNDKLNDYHHKYKCIKKKDFFKTNMFDS